MKLWNDNVTPLKETSDPKYQIKILVVCAGLEYFRQIYWKIGKVSEHVHKMLFFLSSSKLVPKQFL